MAQGFSNGLMATMLGVRGGATGEAGTRISGSKKRTNSTKEILSVKLHEPITFVAETPLSALTVAIAINLIK